MCGARLPLFGMQLWSKWNDVYLHSADFNLSRGVFLDTFMREDIIVTREYVGNQFTVTNFEEYFDIYY